MRAFIGLPLPEKTSTVLYQSIADVRRAHRNVRWIPPENYHITTLFLGEVVGGEIERITTLLDFLPDFIPASGSIGKVIQFPPRGNAKVIVATVDAGVRLCDMVYRQLAGMLPEYTDRRTYTPHITIGRVRRGDRVTGPYSIGQTNPDWRDIRYEIDRITLFQSVLGPSGARYKSLHEVPLSKAARPLK